MYDTNDTNDASDASERAAARREMVSGLREKLLRGALDGARRRIKELEAAAVASEAARDAVVDEHERALVRADQAEAEVARLRAELQATLDQYDRASDERRELREALDCARRRIEELEAVPCERALAVALERADRSEAEVARLRGSVHSLSVALAEVAEARYIAAQRQREEASR